MESPRIRAAVAGDIALLGPIEAAADLMFVAAGHPEFSGTIADADAEAAIAEGRLTVADLEGEVVGWVLMGRLADELCVDQISVHPDQQGRGIGSRLMRHVMAQAREAGEESITLDTQNDVAWNQPWYEKLGFEVVPEGEWTEPMAEVSARQTAFGLDWATRVHMRWRA